MKIEKIVVGELNTNCYIISKNKDCIIIDPGDDYKKINDKINNKKVMAVIITHYHFDHIGAINEFNTEIIDYNYKNGIYNLRNFNFEIIHTPGHKEDCITLYFKKENIMFTGDFIFKNSIGRIDLIGGNEENMIKSLNTISKYNDAIIIYPGHGDNTLLGYEKENFKYYL